MMQTHTSNHRRTGARNPGAKNAAILAADPNKAIQEMMDTIDNVRSVYERETQALENFDTKSFLSLQEEKIETTGLYKSRIENLIQRKNEIRDIDPALKKKLENMQSDFSALSAHNMSALKRMQRTMERLGETVQQAARESLKKQRAFSYGEHGRIHDDNEKRVSIGVSETA